MNDAVFPTDLTLSEAQQDAAFYLAIGLAFSDAKRRRGARAFLYFGPFPDAATAKDYLKQVLLWVQEQSIVTVRIPRLLGASMGKLRIERRKIQPVSCLRDKRTHQPRHAIGELSKEGLQELKTEFDICPIVPTPEEITRIPYHIITQIVDLMVPRRVV